LELSAGLNGVVWFTAVVIAAVFAALFRAPGQTRRGPSDYAAAADVARHVGLDNPTF
jgi:hypothetical protein